MDNVMKHVRRYAALCTVVQILKNDRVKILYFMSGQAKRAAILNLLEMRF